MFNGLYAIASVLIILIFTTISGLAIDKFNNPNCPFIFTGAFDLIFGLYFSYCRLMDKI